MSRHPPAYSSTNGQAREPSAGSGRPGRGRVGPSAGRRQQRRDLRADDGAQRRAAVRRTGRAQGRRDEVRSGAVGVRGRGAGRAGGPVPRVADEAAARRPAHADPRRPPDARRAVRPPVVRAVPRVRRDARRGRQHRPGAPGRVARRPRRRGEGPVPGRRGGAAVGPAPALAHEQAAAAAGAGPGRQTAGRGAARPHGGGARLPRRGREPARVRRGVRRRSPHHGAAGWWRRRPARW